jgi:predicted DNA-binding transcriptional regulator AlpA
LRGNGELRNEIGGPNVIETDGAPAKATYDRLLNVHQVAARLNISARQVWKLAAEDRLPKPVKLGRSARWRKSDIALFIAGGCSMRSDARSKSAPEL